ncbi:MAG: hypothetical protein JRE28_13155 [Deltaproteobacteria bacterium]|nr:hypothetical protein [Deltaproteobacteria bacterium]
MLQKISSIKTTFFCLGSLIGSLLIGVALTFDKHHAIALKSLSRQLPLTWLFNESGTDVVITVWFVAVCLIAGLFFIHLVCCILTRFYRLFQNGFSLRRWLFFLMHIMFVLVMFCHGLSMIMGYKHSDIKMLAGQATRFDKDYILSLSEIKFVDDSAILKASYENQRAMMTRDNIHRDKNYAYFDLSNDNRTLSSGRIYMLAPYRFGSIQITLTDFFIAENRLDNPIGVKLVITKNPITPFFFGTYAVMIISLVGFVIITWHDKKDENIKQRI